MLTHKTEPPIPKRPFLRDLRRSFRIALFFLLVSFLVRLFLFVPFGVSSSSMSYSLLSGDLILVSKVAYGARLPQSLSVPFTNWVLSEDVLPYFRLPGLGNIQRNDIIVFNYPPENRTTDLKTAYVKRVVGMPGDSLQIREKQLSINGKPVPLTSLQTQEWLVTLIDEETVLPPARIEALDLKIRYRISPNVLLVSASVAAIESLKRLPYVSMAAPYIRKALPDQIFPAHSGFSYDEYGPINIPRKNQQVEVDNNNWPLYQAIITRFERNKKVVWKNQQLWINGKHIRTYTFRQNYYFVLGDNRDASSDSKSWGFVPEDHLIGKATRVLYSSDSQTGIPRMERIFLKIE